MRSAPDTRGQASVESAIVMPLMVFLILGIVQLTMVQHARIMLEYAAFNAARAGIVWNADPWIMENAALISLIPTNESLGNEVGVMDPGRMLRRIIDRSMRYQANRRLPEFVGQMATDWGADRVRAHLTSERSLVTISLVSPNRDTFGENAEVDFDDFGARNADTQRAKTRLSIRLQYLYLMRVPFANWLISWSWLAANACVEMYGAVWRPTERAGATGFSAG